MRDTIGYRITFAYYILKKKVNTATNFIAEFDILFHILLCFTFYVTLTGDNYFKLNNLPVNHTDFLIKVKREHL